MQVTGNVISVNLDTKIAKQGGGTYNAWELVYRSPENEVKQLAKPVQSLKFTKGLKDGLESLVVGQDFVAELEKNAKDYWEVITIRRTDDSEVVKQPTAAQDSRAVTPAPAMTKATGGKVTGSNYETPEERAKKQVVIVRQSCLNIAMTFLHSQPDPAAIITLANVIDTAKEFEKFVNNNVGKAATKYMNVIIGETE